jgi:hypothetical protein
MTEAVGTFGGDRYGLRYHCVTVIVSVAVWLTAPPPPADAETETLEVPVGVPGFPVLLLPPPLHEVSADTINRRPSQLKTRSS